MRPIKALPRLIVHVQVMDSVKRRAQLHSKQTQCQRRRTTEYNQRLQGLCALYSRDNLAVNIWAAAANVFEFLNSSLRYDVGDGGLYFRQSVGV
jgi:hypothetical protein